MNPALIMSLIQGGLGAGQMIGGLFQQKNNKRPTYEVPSDIKTMLQLTQRRASESMIPGQGYYENQIDRNAASSLQTARSVASNPAQLLEAATGMNATANTSMEKLALMGIENKNRNVGDYTNALKVMGQYKDKAFDWNEAQKYQEQAGSASSLMGSGMQNMYGAVDNYGSNVLMKQQREAMAKMLKDLQSGSGKSETMTESLNGPANQGNVPDGGLGIDQLQDIIKSWGSNGFGDEGLNMLNFG